MSTPFKYIRDTYNVPACIGRRVTCYGKPGIIVADRGNHIGVTLDSEKPGKVGRYHPTDEVVYGEMGTVRKVSKGASRYSRYLEYGDMFQSFREFLGWDSEPERSWNQSKI